MDFISYTFVNAVISALAVFGCWLILRPQKIENRALHKSIDNNTKALEDLTGLINEMRVAQASVETNITNLRKSKRVAQEEPWDCKEAPEPVPAAHQMDRHRVSCDGLFVCSFLLRILDVSGRDGKNPAARPIGNDTGTSGACHGRLCHLHCRLFRGS